MFPAAVMSNSTSLSEEASVLSANGARIIHHQDLAGNLNNLVSSTTLSPPHQQPPKIKKKRSLPGNPDPDAEVIALSPKTLLATNRFVCEICNKGFQRDQNLQLHRRGHNLPWKLKQRSSKEVKKRAYVCPEPTCVHHNPSRALGDLTGIKKHYCRKHGEKKWKCDKCSKIYAVQSDWKAHSKTCGTREYRCDCGTLFSRKDSFITHRAFCDALAEESARISAATQIGGSTTNPLAQSLFLFPTQQQQPHSTFQNQFNNTTINPSCWDPSSQQNPNPSNHLASSSLHHNIKNEAQTFHIPNNNNNNHHLSFLQHHKSIITSSPPFKNLHHLRTSSNSDTSAYLSATALLQKAATVGTAAITCPNNNAAASASTAASLGVVGQQQHVPHHVTQLSMGEFGKMTQLNNSVVLPDHHHHYTKMKALINKNETRDFLGLTNGGGGAVDVSINVKDMLTFTGSVDYQHQPFDHHHHHHSSLQFKAQQQGFGFLATTTAPESWGNC